MSLKWRLGLVAVVAAAVVGGLVPHTIVYVGGTSRQMMTAAESTLSGPVVCDSATCGKGSPTPAAPSPAVALVAVLGAAAAVAATRGVLRRRRAGLSALPTGARDPLFHPPQFSSPGT